MSEKKYTLTQKLLILVAGAVLIAAFFVLLSVWGVAFSEEFLGRVFLTCLVVVVVGGVLIAILSNLRDESKDRQDKFFN